MTIEDKLNALVDTLVTRETHKGAVNRVRIRAKSQLTALLNEARLIELDLLEQAINDGRDMNAYKLQRLAELDSMRTGEGDV